MITYEHKPSLRWDHKLVSPATVKYSTQKTSCNNDDSSEHNQQEGRVVQGVNDNVEFSQT